MEKSREIFTAQILETAKAINSNLRLRILEEVSRQQMSITQLVEVLGVAQPTVSINVQILESAGLVRTLLGSSREKVIIRTYDSLVIHLPVKTPSPSENVFEVTMPVGLYSSCKVSSPCGLVDTNGVIGLLDDPKSFYLPSRISSSLIYFSEEGYIEYNLPNPLTQFNRIASISFSAELCAEAPGYQQYYPSDITLSLNGKEIGTWTTPGDYGDRKGKNTPEWWNLGNTQYGDLVTWRIDETGCYLNEQLCSGTTINALDITINSPVEARLEVKPDARNRKGMNLFGDGFGDYSQHIKVIYMLDSING